MRSSLLLIAIGSPEFISILSFTAVKSVPSPVQSSIENRDRERESRECDIAICLVPCRGYYRLLHYNNHYLI